MGRKLPSWRCQFRGMTADGRLTQPVIVDEKGRRVRMGQARNAQLAALAPLLAELLEKAERDFFFWTLMLREIHPGIKMPGWIDDARRVLYLIRNRGK